MNTLIWFWQVYNNKVLDTGQEQTLKLQITAVIRSLVFSDLIGMYLAVQSINISGVYGFLSLTAKYSAGVSYH